MAAASLRQAITTDNRGQGPPSGSSAGARARFGSAPIRAMTQANWIQTRRIPARTMVAIGASTPPFYRGSGANPIPRRSDAVSTGGRDQSVSRIFETS
jgi:hypothetical protein